MVWSTPENLNKYILVTELEIIYSSHQCNLSLVLRRAQSSANGKFCDCLSALNFSANLDMNQYPSGPKPGQTFVCLILLFTSHQQSFS